MVLLWRRLRGRLLLDEVVGLAAALMRHARLVLVSAFAAKTEREIERDRLVRSKQQGSPRAGVARLVDLAGLDVLHPLHAR